MKLHHVVEIPVGRKPLWDFLMDVQAVSMCVPGLESIEEEDADNFTGRVKVKIGPITARFSGKVSVTLRDAEAYRAAMRGQGADKRIGGHVQSDVTMNLEELEPERTRMEVDSDVRLFGRIGEFGQPVVKRKADEIMSEFAKNVESRMTTADQSPATSDERGP